MNKVIITFLGDRGALETKYFFQGRDYLGRVFAEALRQFCEYDRMLVCVTAKAREKTWPLLESLHDPRIEAIDIPTGETTEDMWDTFRRITKEVNEGDEVTFDITHGLRSLPFLVFLFAAYLKTAKSVTIHAIYYGALELQDKEKGTPAPVIDLSEFVSMLDWITAADQFVQHGNGEALSHLLRQRMPSGLLMRDDLRERQTGRALKNASDAINQISQSLLLARPLETMQTASRLDEYIRAAADAFDQRAQPVTILAGKLRDAYAPFAVSDPLAADNLSNNLRVQKDMIGWYIDKRQYMQAATLMREFVVSLVLVWLGEQNLTDKDIREAVENAINALTLARRENVPARDTRQQMDNTRLKESNFADDMARLWGRLSNLRNDIAHCGMRKDPRLTEKLIEDIKSLKTDVGKLADKMLDQPQSAAQS